MKELTLGQMIVLVKMAKEMDYNDEYDFFIESGKVIIQKKAIELVPYNHLNREQTFREVMG